MNLLNLSHFAIQYICSYLEPSLNEMDTFILNFKGTIYDEEEHRLKYTMQNISKMMKDVYSFSSTCKKIRNIYIGLCPQKSKIADNTYRIRFIICDLPAHADKIWSIPCPNSLVGNLRGRRWTTPLGKRIRFTKYHLDLDSKFDIKTQPAKYQNLIILPNYLNIQKIPFEDTRFLSELRKIEKGKRDKITYNKKQS